MQKLKNYFKNRKSLDYLLYISSLICLWLLIKVSSFYYNYSIKWPRIVDASKEIALIDSSLFAIYGYTFIAFFIAIWLINRLNNSTLKKCHGRKKAEYFSQEAINFFMFFILFIASFMNIEMFVFEMIAAFKNNLFSNPFYVHYKIQIFLLVLTFIFTIIIFRIMKLIKCAENK